MIYDRAEQRAEAARWQTQQRSLEARRQAAIDERTPEAEAQREHDAASGAQFESELPAHLRDQM